MDVQVDNNAVTAQNGSAATSSDNNINAVPNDNKLVLNVNDRTVKQSIVDNLHTSIGTGWTIKTVNNKVTVTFRNVELKIRATESLMLLDQVRNLIG